MIGRLKSALIKIRENREKELLLVAPTWIGEEERRKQRSLLILEPPFSIKKQDITLARATIRKDKEEKSKMKKSKTIYQIISAWKKSGGPDEVIARGSFCDLLQRCHVLSYHRDLGYKTEPIRIDELVDSKSHLLPTMIQCIDQSQLENSKKTTYLGYAQHLCNFIEKDMHISPPITFKKKEHLSISDSEKLFDYLESRALRSTTVRAYSDLLLCRALFYAPLPAKKLFVLSAPTRKPKGWFVKVNKALFRVPTSLTTLWKAFSLEDRLLPENFDEDYLSQKLRRLGKYADLSTTLNPSILRRSLESVMNELGIDPFVAEQTPPR